MASSRGVWALRPVQGSVLEVGWGPCCVLLVQDVCFPSILVAALSSFWDACFLWAVVMVGLV